MNALVALAIACVLAMGAPAAGAADDLARHVDPMIGTVPVGFTVPGAVVPFGMVQNSPDTTGEFAYSGYLATDPVIRGFSLVHLSGPGVRKAGDLPFMPHVGPSVPREPSGYASPWNRALEDAQAGYYTTYLEAPATKVELTAFTRTAMQRYTFPPTTQANLIADVSRSIEGVHDGKFKVTGPTEIQGSAKGRYPVHFVARFSQPFTDSGVFKAEGKGAGGWVRFDTTNTQTVTMRVGISFVDVDGARRNLDAEAPTFDFDGMRKAARAFWNARLAAIELDGGSSGDLTTFYTALYHSLLHPNVFTDVDGRYLGFDKKPHRARGRVQYANFSSWDLYKSWHQLVALLEPRRYRQMLQTLLANHREGGYMPRWGEQNFDASHMTGDPAIAMIAEGYCRGSVEPALAKSLYSAAVTLTRRREPDLYKYNYLPHELGSRTASQTLEYGIADFALAVIADAMGRKADARKYAKRSLNYRNLLNPETGWITPRSKTGQWLSDFDPTDERGFQEGNSWQYSWLAPHDAGGLFDRMGGDGVVNQRLDQHFSQPPEAQNRATVFGLVYRTDQWAPGNEHDLQTPWMHAFAGRPWKGAQELAEVRSLYRPTPDGLPGNDDLGGLSSWHVLNALGVGAVTPGAPFYVIGSPQFDRARLHLPRRGTFTISTSGTGPYVRSATLNGRRLPRAWFIDRHLRGGGELKLEMGTEPETSWGRAKEQRPPSVTGWRLSGFGCRPKRP